MGGFDSDFDEIVEPAFPPLQVLMKFSSSFAHSSFEFSFLKNIKNQKQIESIALYFSLDSLIILFK